MNKMEEFLEFNCIKHNSQNIDMTTSLLVIDAFSNKISTEAFCRSIHNKLKENTSVYIYVILTKLRHGYCETHK